MTISEILQRTQLSQGDLAYVYGVSRYTVMSWANRGREPVTLQRHINRYNKALLQLVSRGKLPLDKTLQRKERRAKLDELLADLRESE